MKFFLLLGFFFHFSLHAELFRGPVSSSMAGTGRAAMDSAEGGLLNPALVPLLKDYEIDAYYKDGTLDPGQHHHLWSLGAGDNGPDVLFPATFHYVRERRTGYLPDPVESDLWHAAIGRVSLPKLSLGISGYRLSYNIPGAKQAVQWNYSLGALYVVSQDIGLGYTLNNIAHPGSDVPQVLRERLQQGLGFFASIFNIARARVDITRNETNNVDKKMAYMAGFESLSGHFAILRAGFKRDDEADQSYITAGFSFNGPRLKVDYSFEKNIHGTSGALHGVDIRIPF